MKYKYRKRNKEYVRDGRAPIPDKELTSFVMSRIKGKNTKPELILRKALWATDLRGYRLHYKKVPGNPDIAYVGKKVAIFVNGCFWHRCPHCLPPIPKKNKKYWNDKLLKNVSRDRKYQKALKKEGWRVIVVWECQIKKDLNKCISKIYKYYINDLYED